MSANSALKATLAPSKSQESSSNLIPRTKKQPLNAVFDVLKPSGQKTGKSWATFRQMNPLYKLPKICRNSDGDWYVEFSFAYPDQPGKFKRFKARGGINYIKDPKSKEKAIEELRANITYAITHLGYNPFAAEEKILGEIVRQEKEQEIKQSRWTIIHAIQQYKNYIHKKQLAAASIRTYENHLFLLSEWVKATDLNDFHICDFTEKQFIQFVDSYSSDNKWSARTYNNNVKFFRGFFSRCARMEHKENADVKYKMDFEDVILKNNKAERNRYYNERMAKLVKEKLDSHPNKYLGMFCEWIYYSCMRPKEISLLKIEHIDTDARQIKVAGPTAKTGDRYVPICDELLELIERMELKHYPHTYFIFGHDGSPSDKSFRKDYFSKKYIAIKESLGLDDNYTLYGWKHTRVVNLLKAGFKDREVMELTGHRDTHSFDVYKRELMINPDSRLTGATIEF